MRSLMACLSATSHDMRVSAVADCSIAGTASRRASTRLTASLSELAAASLRSWPRSRRLAADSSMVLASHTVQVTSEADINPIITAFTTTSAAMNMLHGDKSCGRFACGTPVVAAVGTATAVGVGVATGGDGTFSCEGAVTSYAAGGVAGGAVDPATGCAADGADCAVDGAGAIAVEGDASVTGAGVAVALGATTSGARMESEGCATCGATAGAVLVARLGGATAGASGAASCA